uniref:PWWP domain-containing protein n=1 Tax=Rhizophora mucronata TaxID=61149 RepID=A0A2P2LJH0_RHIMU
MGSSGEPNNNLKAIDASVGSLVWVQRRNGSWWPGRIIGMDEISEGSLASPRLGTPVKLLGREDASVDWYNLEKSKRVKAFRCGEYDECIEKARAAAANGNKKAVKYARREDAILHALEIENARLGKDHLDLFSRTNNSSGEKSLSVKESVDMSLSAKEDEDITAEKTDSDGSDSDSDSDPSSDTGSDSDSGSAPELSQSGISFEEPNHAGVTKAQSVQAKRRKTPNDSEDDGTEGAKRMRGLEDLGIGVGDSNTGNCMSNGTPVNGSKAFNSSMKRKNSQSANVQEFLKRKNRRRPLTKVLESTAMVSIPVLCNQLPSSCGSSLQGLSDSKISGVDSNDSKKSLCVVINNNSDSTGVSCENPSEPACDTSPTNSKVRKDNDISSISGLMENDSTDKLFDVPFVGEEKQATGFSPMLVASSSLRHQRGGLRRQCSQSSQAEAMTLKNEGLNESATSLPSDHVNNIGQSIDKGTSKWQLKGKRNSRHVNKSRKQYLRNDMDTDDESNPYLAGMGRRDGFLPGSFRPCTEDHVDGNEEWSKPFSYGDPHIGGPLRELSLLPQRSLPYRQSRFMRNSKYQTADFPGRSLCTASKLYEVKLEVKATYRPQHVPLVSLMSKLNGKAIVGHPLTIEPLDDGYCNDIISSSESDATKVTILEAAEHGNAVHHSKAGRVSTKHIPMQPRFSPSKSPKSRKSGLLSKKTRKLSSLTGNKEEYRKPVGEKLKGPVIACIPLKLVFSRLNEGVNGSARQTQRALT